MQHLKEMPKGTIWPNLLEGIEHDALADVRQYAQGRINDVTRGAETPELAALLVDKYCEGMAKALHIVGVDSLVRKEGDRLVREIDPAFDAHLEARWAARPASLFCGSRNPPHHADIEISRLREVLEGIADPNKTPSSGDPLVLREIARMALNNN